MRNSLLSQLSFWRDKRLPVLLQTEAAECGLACLCMIASYWGHQIDISSMRRRFSVSLKGVTLKSLMVMAQGLLLQARPLKLEVNQMLNLHTPCIIHWDLNHFVVLKAVKGNYVIIHDPATGERRLLLNDVAKHFTGIALELRPTTFFKKHRETQKFTLLSLMGNVYGLKRGLVQILILGVALQIFTLIAPFYLQWLVDEALLSADRDLITVLGIGFLLLVLIQTAIGAVRSWFTIVFATNLNIQWLGNAFSHLIKLPLPYFEKRHIGDIVSRFTSIQTIQQSITTQFVEGIIDGFLVIGTLIMMLLYSTTLALLACSTVIIYILLRWSIFRSLREATAEQIIHSARQQTHFMESVRGIQSIRLFCKNDERTTGWMNSLIEQFNADLRISKLSLTSHTANVFIFNAERIIIIWLAALAVLKNEFSVGMLFAFISYKDQFSQRISSLVDKLFELKMLRIHGERVADIIMTEVEADDYNSEVNLKDITPSIELRNVSFRYSDSEPNVLKNLDLTIHAGQCIAITGKSGCGKTTLLKILLGLLQPTEGEIFVGGIDIRKIGLNNYRQMLGTVMQEDTLFAGSISDNISFFDSSPDQEKIEISARLSNVEEEILNMPMNYNSLVGDIGTGLSGGQRQRILLARALYRNPKILILDEATSHLDFHNEEAVNKAIKEIRLTRVIVAHRLETINMSNRIVVLQSGEIIEDQTTSEFKDIAFSY
jgi:ATP-binding cassette subfamily B protein RaxB